MIRRIITLSIVHLGFILVFSFCNSGIPDQMAEEKTGPLSISENSGAFNQSFASLLNAYYSLRDAFVASDTVKVNEAATALTATADSLKVSELQGDTSGAIRETAQFFAATISSSGKAVTGEKEIDAKRKEFNMISDALWNLTRTVHYDGQKLYYQFCPMAFDNTGAYWLSADKEIRNPYFGSKMLKCGEVTDSLDYRK